MANIEKRLHPCLTGLFKLTISVIPCLQGAETPRPLKPNQGLLPMPLGLFGWPPLTLFLLGGGVNLTPPVVFFYITQKVLV